MAIYAGVSARQLAKDIESTGVRIRLARPPLDSDAQKIELILTNEVSIVWDRSSGWVGAVGWFPDMARMESMLLKLYGESRLRRTVREAAWFLAVLAAVALLGSVLVQILR